MIYYFITTILFIYGVFGSSRPDMILSFFRRKLSSILYYRSDDCNFIKSKRNTVAYYVIKVLFDCTPCMASIYGTLSYFIFVYPHSGWAILHWPIWVFCLSGANYLINKLTNR